MTKYKSWIPKLPSIIIFLLCQICLGRRDAAITINYDDATGIEVDPLIDTAPTLEPPLVVRASNGRFRKSALAKKGSKGGKFRFKKGGSKSSKKYFRHEYYDDALVVVSPSSLPVDDEVIVDRIYTKSGKAKSFRFKKGGSKSSKKYFRHEYYDDALVVVSPSSLPVDDEVIVDRIYTKSGKAKNHFPYHQKSVIHDDVIVVQTPSDIIDDAIVYHPVSKKGGKNVKQVLSNDFVTVHDDTIIVNPLSDTASNGNTIFDATTPLVTLGNNVVSPLTKSAIDFKGTTNLGSQQIPIDKTPVTKDYNIGYTPGKVNKR